MAAAADSPLLLKFKTKNTVAGVTRKTLKEIAKALEVTETQVIHTAIARFAQDVLPGYERDDGELTTSQLAALRKLAGETLPRGRVLSTTSLF